MHGGRQCERYVYAQGGHMVEASGAPAALGCLHKSGLVKMVINFERKIKICSSFRAHHDTS